MTVLDYYTFMVLMDGWFILYHRGTTISSPLEIFRSYNSAHICHYRSVVAATKRKGKVQLLWNNKLSTYFIKNGKFKRACTFSVELESMERMLMQIELTVMAGDHESYRISTKDRPQML